MRVLFVIRHPAHLHLFKNTITNLRKRGNVITIIARRKECTLELLDAYGLNYEFVDVFYKSLFMKGYGMLRWDYELYKLIRKYKPDVMLGVLDPYIAQVGKLLKTPSITFTDTEETKLANGLTLPFTNVICTPSCYKRRLNPRKHVKYEGYHELAYLHPAHFKPEPAVLDNLGISEGDKFIILRFISWSAHHDVTLKGIDKEAELDFIKSLERYGSVFITSERKLDAALEKFRFTVLPEKMHSLLYYADLYIGEGGTMAAEAAILGTPAIHVESNSSGIATGELSGNFLELRDRYGLLYFYPDQNQALAKATSILEDKNSKKEWQKRREKLLKDKIDVTAWMTDFIERYPESFYEYKQQQQSTGTNK